MPVEYLNAGSLNTYTTPLQVDGQLVHALNVVGFPYGAYSKRPGYGTAIGTVSGRVQNLFSFAPYPTGSGTNLFLYAAAGSLLYQSTQGTASWAVAGNGTITDGNHVGHAVLNNVLIVGDGAGSTRHTSDGTSFTNTTSAPIAQYFAQFHQRIYASNGTSATLTYSSNGSADNWSISLPADSSSFTVPNEGAISSHIVAGDRLNITKQRGDMFNWDDTTLVDMATKYGPSSPWSWGRIDDTWFYLNQFGLFSFDGATKTVISNPIQRMFYNRQNTGIGTAAWGTAPGVGHIWDYLVAVGTVTDDFTGRQINNAIIRYDYQKNQFTNWSFAHPPTAFHSYNDSNNKRQLLFGDASGNIFQLDPSKTSDNGTAIQSELVFLFNYSSQSQIFTPTSASAISSVTYEEKWNYIRLIFNPGDEVNIQFAFTNTLTYQHLKWSGVINTNKRTGDYYQVADGVVEIRFPRDENNMPRSRFLFVRIYDDSDSSAWTYYGAQIDADPMIVR